MKATFIVLVGVWLSLVAPMTLATKDTPTTTTTTSKNKQDLLRTMNNKHQNHNNNINNIHTKDNAAAGAAAADRVPPYFETPLGVSIDSQRTALEAWREERRQIEAEMLTRYAAETTSAKTNHAHANVVEGNKKTHPAASAHVDAKSMSSLPSTWFFEQQANYDAIYVNGKMLWIIRIVTHPQFM